MRDRVVVFGAGGHSLCVIECLEMSGTSPEAIYDDNSTLWGSSRRGYNIVGGREALCLLPRDQISVVIAVALNYVRKRIVQELHELGFNLQGVRHPGAIISKHAHVSETAQLLNGAIVDYEVKVGEHSILDYGALIGHESRVGNFVHIATRATVAGKTEIREGAMVGLSACVLPFKTVGAWAKVGAGSVVWANVRDRTTVVGVPAKEIWWDNPIA